MTSTVMMTCLKQPLKIHYPSFFFHFKILCVFLHSKKKEMAFMNLNFFHSNRGSSSSSSKRRRRRVEKYSLNIPCFTSKYVNFKNVIATRYPRYPGGGDHSPFPLLLSFLILKYLCIYIYNTCIIQGIQLRSTSCRYLYIDIH